MLANFSVLAMHPISFLSAQELDDIETTDTKNLCEIYGSTHSKVEGRENRASENFPAFS